MLCPRCLKEGVKVNMIYDPKTHEYYCPRCGYVVENVEEAYAPVVAGDDPNKPLGYSPEVVSTVDKNMGSKLTVDDLMNIIVSVREGTRVMNRNEIKYLLSSDENKTFRDNLDDLKTIVARLNEKNYKISFSEVEEIVNYAGKVFNRSLPVKNRRFYKSIYVFFAILYHYLIYKYPERQKSEILNDLVEIAYDFVETRNKSSIIKSIERKYDAIKQLLPKPKLTLADKIRYVAERFNVDPNTALCVARNYVDTQMLSNHSADTIAYAVVYYVMKYVEGREPPEELKHLFGTGVKSLASQIKAVAENNGEKGCD